MLQKKLCLVVTFDATAAAMAAEKYCLERGVPGRLIPVPREILAWKAAAEQEEAVTAALEEAGIKYGGVYRIEI